MSVVALKPPLGLLQSSPRPCAILLTSRGTRTPLQRLGRTSIEVCRGAGLLKHTIGPLLEERPRNIQGHLVDRPRDTVPVRSPIR